MANTKIINVLGSDSFEDVYNHFMGMEAQEVIFIFPKGSRFARNEHNFEALKSEAVRKGASISVLSSDKEVRTIAVKYGFNVLENRSVTAGTVLAGDNETPLARVASTEFNNDENNVVLTASKKTTSDPKKREIHDIRVIEQDHTIKIRKDKSDYKAQDIEVTASDETPSEEGESMKVEQTPVPEDVPVQSTYENVKSAAQKLSEQYKEDLDQNIHDDEVRKRVAGATDTESMEISKLWAEEEARQGETSEAGQKKGFALKFNFFSKTPLIILGIAIVVLGLILYLTLGSARVSIKPQRQDLNFPINSITASSATDEVSLLDNTIPGQQFSIEVTESESYPASGEKEVAQKARGMITIENESSVDQKLIATTRFETQDGLIFRIPESVNVPSGGEIKVTVYADKPGREYNIATAVFTIPGFEGSEKFDQFSATSSATFTGGIVGLSSVVSSDDYETAVAQLTEVLRQSILDGLNDQAGDLTIADSIHIKIEEPIANVSSGEAADSLELSLSGSATVLGFRESDIMVLAQEYISDSGDLDILDKSLDLTYSDVETSEDGIEMSFDAQVAGTAVARIDIDSIKNSIVGMNRAELDTFFKGFEEIAFVRIDLSPIWVRSVPSNTEKVEVIVDLAE